MVRSEWLSECLRVGSRQPFESHLLDTVTLTTVSKFAKRNTAAAAAAARSAAGGGGLQNDVINPCWNWPVFQKAQWQMLDGRGCCKSGGIDAAWCSVCRWHVLEGLLVHTFVKCLPPAVHSGDFRSAFLFVVS